MSQSFTKDAGVELDTSGVEQLMAAIRGAGVEPASMRSRLREFLKRGFPSGARAGQGRRTAYGIGELHEIAIGFELADLGLSSAKSIAVVQQNVAVLKALCVDAFNWLRTMSRMDADARSRSIKLDWQSYQLMVAPTGVTHGEGAYIAFGSGGSMPLGSPLRHSHLNINILSLVADIDDALAGDTFRYRQNEIDQAYANWAGDLRDPSQAGSWWKGETPVRDQRVAR